MSVRDLCYQLFKRKQISVFKKKRFASFGRGSVIEKPYLQLSNIEKISIGQNVSILQGCRLAVYGEGQNEAIKIGDRCVVGFGFTALAAAKGKIVIGNDVLIASNALVTNEDHGIDPESEISYMEQELSHKDVVIGDGCWIGEKVCILSGVTIGKRCIVGAGSVVTKAIPDYSIAVGNPARVIKRYSFENHRWEKI